MSLYYEAARFTGLQIKTIWLAPSRVFGSTDLKSKPSQLYALLAEASKWSEILSEVIQKAESPTRTKGTRKIDLITITGSTLTIKVCGLAFS